MKNPHHLIISFLILLLLLLHGTRARAQDPDWYVLDEVRITFYGPRYVGGEIMASDVRYMKDNDTVALGPYHLQMVRDYYDAQQAFRWWWLPGWKLRHRAPAACYPVMASLNEARWWGCLVRVCADTADGERLCRWLRVADTGRPELEADLPDETWQRWGYSLEQGVFTGTLEVLTY
jgi:hypothetical protein